MASHDHAYKLLFSHPRLVRDLLRGFVREKWLARLDLASLERVNSSFVTDRLRARTSDMVWRVRVVGGQGYLHVLLEFQSTVEHYMAVRMLTYVGLLLQEQIRANQVSDRRLPAVFPIVLHTGKRQWNAPTKLSAILQTHGGLPSRFRPHVRFHLIDARHLSTHAPHLKDNLAAVLFRMENSRTHGEIDDALRCLFANLKGPESASLRQAFSVWINRIILARLPGGPLNEIPELKEMCTVLEYRFAELEEQFRASGMREGMRKGMSEGLLKGRLEGIRQGKVDLLLEQLRKRFGSRLPRYVRERVQQSNVEQLSRWGERLLDARSLAQLFPVRRRTTRLHRRGSTAAGARAEAL